MRFYTLEVQQPKIHQVHLFYGNVTYDVYRHMQCKSTIGERTTYQFMRVGPTKFQLKTSSNNHVSDETLTKTYFTSHVVNTMMTTSIKHNEANCQPWIKAVKKQAMAVTTILMAIGIFSPIPIQIPLV